VRLGSWDVLGGRHGRDLGGERAGGVANGRFGQQVAGLLGDGVRGDLLAEEAVADTGRYHGFGIGELVGALRHQELRETGAERTKRGAAAAVVDDQVDVRQQPRLRDPRLEPDIRRDVTELGLIDGRAGGDQDVDVERREPLDRRAEHAGMPHRGAERQVDQRTAPVDDSRGQLTRLAPADRP